LVLHFAETNRDYVTNTNRMKRKISSLLASLLIAGTCLTAQAQDTPEEQAPNTLNDQFQELKRVSNNYQEYEVIRVSSLNALWNNVRDSLNEQQKQVLNLQQQINSQEQELARLQDQLEQKQEEVDASAYDMAHINVLGINVEKNNYIIFNWIVILLLLLALGIMYARYRSSNKLSIQKRTDYEVLEQEFNDFKIRAREKETRLMRELQTERNEVEDLHKRLSTLNKGRSGSV
jgi:DNA repair exonuclease SbcCD ATPase subunit